MTKVDTQPLFACVQSLPVKSEGEDEVLTMFENTGEGPLWTKMANDNPALASLLTVMWKEARYLRDLMSREPKGLLKLLDTPIEESASGLLDTVLANGAEEESEADIMRRLRLLKQEAALLAALADLGKAWSTKRVTRFLTDFADATLLASLRFALKLEASRGKLLLKSDVTPEEGSGIVILAMGKHGARELNYSSDIDIVVFFDDEAKIVVNRGEEMKIMVRVVRTLVKLMQERTEHGYVFRTDLRLRPDPGATPVAISTEAALNYYESLGQNWERAAFIKARAVACDQKAAATFLKALSPFVWRKYMDFATIADTHALKRQTHAHKGHGAIATHGHNVKLGRGGIREIEFFVQTQQLIAGGRNPILRVSDTVNALSALAREGWISEEVRDDLVSSYWFLRDVEHRIQMLNDEQTHTLPTDHETFGAIGRLMGFAECASFETALLKHLKMVTTHYRALFEREDALSIEQGALVFVGDDDDPATLETLTHLGFTKADQISSLIRQWHYGRYRAMRSTQAREALTAITPRFLLALSKTDNPDGAFFTFDSFLKSLPAGIQLFSLLRAEKSLLELLAQVMGSAPRLSATIGRHPHVFDALLDPAFFGSVPDRESLSTQLDAFLDEARGYEDVLDRIRIVVQEHHFLIGARYIFGMVNVEEAQALYALIAELILERMIPIVEDEMAIRHGRVPSGEIAVIAMGKLGSCEMTPTSDLDLILVYQVNEDVKQSDGRMPLAVSQYYARFTQRFIAALTAPTGEGIAYEVDLRLRPSGKSGPLATDVEAFEKYQKEDAWTWEHMALVRARPIAGSARLVTRIEEIIADVLSSPRDTDKLRVDVFEMNERLHTDKEDHGFWDVKSTRGGLVDIEFIAQHAVLREAAAGRPIQHRNTGKILAALQEANYFATDDAVTLRNAYALYSRLIYVLRLCVDGPFESEKVTAGLSARLCTISDVPDLKRLELKIMEFQQAVREIMSRSVGMLCDLEKRHAAHVSGAAQPVRNTE